MMNLTNIRKRLNISLPILGIALGIFYDICDTACSYLHGTLFGVDLVLVGIFLMGALLVLNVPFLSRKRFFVDQSRTMLLSGALGGEVLLVRFQIVNDVYCPFCIVFGMLVLFLFMINFRPMNRILAVASFVAGLLLFRFFFEGSLIPLFFGTW
ncbi:MAG: hypothetical protein PHU03_01045 [Syntrophales bacterium]|nr:hypothetical protein [Syntrophales bacterium]